MTGLDPGPPRHRRDRHDRHRRQLEIVAEGPDLVVHQPAEALAGMDEVVRTMHTSSGLLPAIEASTITLEEAGAQTLEFIKAARAGAPHRPAVRQLDRHRPALPGHLPPRDRGAPPLPLGRRVHDQGAHPPVVPRGARRRARARPPPTAPSTTSASRSASCAGTASTCSGPPTEAEAARRIAVDRPVKIGSTVQDGPRPRRRAAAEAPGAGARRAGGHRGRAERPAVAAARVPARASAT